MSFEALYGRHFGLVWSLVARAGIAPESREDVVQEIWLTVHRRLDSYDGSAPAASWIAGIARHVTWRQIRAVIRARRKLLALDRVAPEAVDDPLLWRERLRGIEAVIGGLEPIFREAFVAVEIFGATGPEAAAQLGLPLNTLYSRLRLARARVHAGLDALEPDREATAPRGLADRTWLAIAPTLGLGTVAPATMLPFAVGLVAAVGVAVTVIAAVTTPDTPTDAIDVIARAEAGTPEVAPASPRIDVETDAGASAVAPTIVATTAVPRSPVRAETTAARGLDEVPARGRDAAPPTTAPRGVDEEAALLTRAIAALRDGQLDVAWAAIGEHETRFPGGALAIDRRVARVRALCLSGKTKQARGEAAVLRREHGDRPAVAALDEPCTTPG